MVLPRIITSLIGAPLILLTLWWGSLPYLALTVGLVFLALWEFYTLSELGGYPAQIWPGLTAGSLLVLSLYLGGSPTGRLSQNPGAPFLLTLSLFAFFLCEFPRSQKGHSLLRIMTTLLGLLLVAWPLGHMLLLRDIRAIELPTRHTVGRDLSLMAILSLWALDTGAWLTGRVLGRKPLAESVSPKKTWEGALGGWVVCVCVGLLVREATLKDILGRGETLLVLAVLGVLAQVSDLVGSFVKRSWGAKDFSTLLPGHGGILDRFDSFVFAIPFLYYYLIGTGRFQ